MPLRPPRHGLLITLTVAACSGAAPAPEGADAANAPGDTPRAAGEQLLAQPPNGWRQIGATNLPTLRRAEFIPDSETEESWTRRITFEAMVEDPLPDPIAFVDLVTADRERACGTFERLPTFSGEENGYPTSVALLVCYHDRKTDHSEVMLMKTIRGNEAFYIITRGQRGPPIPDGEKVDIPEVEIGAWALYLRSVQLCDPGRAGHPCPGTDSE